MGQPRNKKFGIVFDLGGTLTVRTPDDFDYSGPWREYLAQSGSETESTKHLARIQRAEKKTYHDCLQIQKSYRIVDILRMAKVPYLAQAVQAYKNSWEVFTVIDDETREVLSQLKQYGHTLGIISNTIWPGAWHQEFLKRDGVHDMFDAMLFSSEFLVTKPSPKIFLECVKLMGFTSPRNVFFVGDRIEEDIRGANRAGLRSVLFDPNYEAERHSSDTETRPDHVIREITEILDLTSHFRRT